MNIIEIQDSLKDLPDSALMKEMQMPTGTAPQFLVLSELKRRKRMRDDYQRQQNADMKTVAEEAVTAAGMPQEGIMQVSQAMNPNSSIAQNTGMGMAAPVQPTQAPQMMADGGVVKMQQGGGFAARPGPMTGGVASAIAMLRENYPKLYDQYKDSPELERVAAAAMSGMVAKTPELTSLEQFEAPRDYDFLQSLFTDPSNRAVTKKAAEIEAMQPELNAAAEAQRAAALATGAYDSDEPYVEDITKIVGRPDDPVIVDPREIVEAQATKSPIDESVYGGQPQYMKRLHPRDTEGYTRGTGLAVNLPDRPVDYDRTGSEQSFVLQRPEGALLNVPTTKGGDRPSTIDTSEFKSFDVRSGMGDVYAEPEKIRAAEDAALAGIGSLGGAITMDEAVAAAALQRRNEPLSSQVEQPMLIDQQATALIPDDRSMESAARDQRERFLRAQEIRGDYLGSIVPDDTLSSELADLGEASVEGIGGAFEAGVDALQSMTEGGDGEMPEPTPESALPEGFRLGDRNSPDAEGAFSIGDLLPKGKDTSVSPLGNKSTSKSSGTGGGVSGRIAQMLEDREKSAEADKWMALAQTGMALMASKNPTLGGALGEAGLIGVGAMQKSRQQYNKDILDLLTLQERSRRTGSKGGLTAGNMISYLDDLGRQKSDLREEIRDINNNPLLTDEQKAAQIAEVQVLMNQIDYEAGIYRKSLRGDTTGGKSFDVSGGSQFQGGVGLSLGTPTS